MEGPNILSEKKILFVDHYDSFSFNLLSWLKGKDCPVAIEHIYFDDPRLEDKASHPCPLVLSPGPKSPQEALPSLALIDRFYKKAPIFGVCLGHQLLASYHGAQIVRAKHPFHGSQRRIYPTRHAQLSPLALSSPFLAASYNSLVAKVSAGLDSKVLATNEWGEVEALFFPESSSLGLQFHPESFLSEKQNVFRHWWLSEVLKFYAA